MTAVLAALLALCVFPGLLFAAAGGLAAEFVDRKLHARMQNRVGPPWFQPLADFVKLLSKEELIPGQADRFVFRAMPILALAAATTALFCIPLFGPRAISRFEGDALVVLYLLTLPTLSFFLGGWASTSPYASIGSMRSLTQLFAYEVPLLMVLMAPGLLAGSWSLSGMALFFQAHALLALSNLPGLCVALVALLGKLEKVPFDLAEAETEIVAGTFTEYSGRRLAFFRLAVDVEAVVAASLLASVFLPWGLSLPLAATVPLYLFKVLAVLFVLALLRTILARLRLEQMLEFCWKWLAPAAMLQLLISVLLAGGLSR
ncbi:MAG TPA: complex I subunit 1 family protein [Myxococcales bacterium]|nr:complex I subunit 1 family protein [Myxococcales bacterium]